MSKNADLTSEAGFRDYLAHLFELTSSMMKSFGYLSPVAHVAVRANPHTGEKLEETGIMTVVCPELSSEQHKDAWIETLRDLCKKTNAVGAVLVNEAWMVQADTNEVSKDGKSLLDTPPSKHPRRVEVVIMMVEHAKFGREMWIANIIRNGDEVSLGEFAKNGDGGITGRFTQFIPQTSMN
jgi:hypothetical protein